MKILGIDPGLTQTGYGIIQAVGDNVEMIDKGGYKFNKYCPHAGEDLSEVDIIDNCITCPRHHWKWDLNTGKCIRGGNINLTMEKK